MLLSKAPLPVKQFKKIFSFEAQIAFLIDSRGQKHSADKRCKTINFTLFARNFTDFQEFGENISISRLNPPSPGGSNDIQHAIFAINVNPLPAGGRNSPSLGSESRPPRARSRLLVSLPH